MLNEQIADVTKKKVNFKLPDVALLVQVQYPEKVELCGAG
jgi:hypothetical protein